MPFDAARFDAVVCQFGAMFFPDRVAGYRDAAIGLCEGTPMRGEIEARSSGPAGVGAATDAAAAVLAAEFGSGPIEAPMQALMIAARD